MTRTFLIRCLGLALILAMLLPLAQGALASVPRYPQKSDLNPITDGAGILSPNTVKDLKTFRDTLVNQTGVGLWVATVLFLDGTDMPTYARELFRFWNLRDEDFLLLLCAGEDSYYTVAGSTLINRGLPENTQQVILAANFHSSFMQQRYDEAIARYIPALASQLSKQYGVNLSTVNLFGSPEATPAPTPAPTPRPKFDSSSTNFRQQTRQEESGFSLGSLFVLFLLFSLIFGSRRRRLGDRAGCMGCGCGPLGWIFAGLGLNELFRNRNRW